MTRPTADGAAFTPVDQGSHSTSPVTPGGVTIGPAQLRYPSDRLRTCAAMIVFDGKEVFTPVEEIVQPRHCAMIIDVENAAAKSSEGATPPVSATIGISLQSFARPDLHT